MSLSVVPVAGGVAHLGAWGSLHLTGATSAVIKARQTFDIELPPAVAASLARAGIVLNDVDGYLLVLPYADDTIARVDLTGSDEQCSFITIPRDADKGMRLAHLRLVDDDGALFLSERSLLFFDTELRLAWRCDEEFDGWDFERITEEHVHLLFSDWSGREERQVRSLRDGRRTG